MYSSLRPSAAVSSPLNWRACSGTWASPTPLWMSLDNIYRQLGWGDATHRRSFCQNNEATLLFVISTLLLGRLQCHVALLDENNYAPNYPYPGNTCCLFLALLSPEPPSLYLIVILVCWSKCDSCLADNKLAEINPSYYLSTFLLVYIQKVHF